MDSEDLTRQQTSVIYDRVNPMLIYLTRLLGRMSKRKFPDDDKLVILTAKAREAIYNLRQELHCRSAAGIPRERKRKS